MFKALRTFQVQRADGSYRQVSSGDDVPEAASWKQLEAYIRRRWITDERGNIYNGRHYTPFVSKAQRPLVAKTEKPAPKVEAPAPSPVPVLSTPAYVQGELERLKKSDLVAIAESLNAPSWGNKAELIEAILGAK